jgi:acetyltransferase-like isoleucine patch superfamily enzyme
LQRTGRQGDSRHAMLEKIRSLQNLLQREKLENFKRRLPWGDLLTDRWDNAREYGFGEGTSCYDSALVLGDVKVGKHTWIGPHVVLDGIGSPLVIGDYCALSAGVQIYTHDTVKWCVTLGRATKIEGSPTTIGNGVYVGPNTVIARGVTVGDSVVIGAMSFVNDDIPARKKAWGCPAVVVGDVEC